MPGQTKIQDLWYKTKWYNRSIMQQYQQEALANPEVQRRIKILDFFSIYDLTTTIDAYKVSKFTLYRWKKLWIRSNKNPLSLLPKSRKPKHCREANTDWRIVEFVKRLRKERFRLGKDKIKPLLDAYCERENLATVSNSTIGNILRRSNLTSSTRVYYTPHGRVKHIRKNSYKDRVKEAPKVYSLGYLEIDTMEIFENGIKRYIYNAVDIKCKFTFAYGYTRKTSDTSTNFFEKLLSVYPVYNGIHTIQTDNGSEFKGNFHKYLIKHKIKHRYIYPRSPKINGVVERCNRSLQEEYINRKELRNIDLFNRGFMEYLVWFNTERVHYSLDNVTPIDYLLHNPVLSHMYVTHTGSCIIATLLI